MARRGPDSTLRFLPSPTVGGGNQADDYWELVKEGPIALPETTTTGMSNGGKGGRLRQRWMMLAKLRCNCGCLAGDKSNPTRSQAIMLRTSKLSGAGRRKVQEYDLSCYRMVTSAFSSSSGTLGPKTGGGNYHFTIHAAADYTFAAVDELCMLSWIAALKEVLLPPVHQHGGKYFAVEYSRSNYQVGLHANAAHVSTQTISLLDLGESTIQMKHPLTEEVTTEWPIATVTDLDVHTQRQCLEVKVCPKCKTGNVSAYRINTQCSVRRLAEAILLKKNLQVPGPPGQREWSCSLPHSCCAGPTSAASAGYTKLLQPAEAATNTMPVGPPRKVTLRRRSLGVSTIDKQMTALREGEVVNIRRSLPPESLTSPRSPVAPQRLSLVEVSGARDGYLDMKNSDSTQGSGEATFGRSKSESFAQPECPSPVPRKHARLSRAMDSMRAPVHPKQRTVHNDAYRTESSQSTCSCASSAASDNRGFGCRLHVSMSSASTTSPVSDNLDCSDDEGYISMAQQSRRQATRNLAACSSNASTTPPTASRRSSFLGDERPPPMPPKPAFLRMLSGASSAGLEFDQSPGHMPVDCNLDYEDVETEDDTDEEDAATDSSALVLPMYAPLHYVTSRDEFPAVGVYESWEEDQSEACHYIVPDNVPQPMKRSSTEPALASTSGRHSYQVEEAHEEDCASNGAYITLLSEGNGSPLVELSEIPPATEARGEEPQKWMVHQIELQRSIKLRLARHNCKERYKTAPHTQSPTGILHENHPGRERCHDTPRPKPRGITRNSPRTLTF